MTEQLLTGFEKAAVLLKSLAPTTSEKVLRQLEPQKASLLKAEFSKLAKRRDLKETMARVLEEVAAILDKDNPNRQPDDRPAPKKETANAEGKNGPGELTGGTRGENATKVGEPAGGGEEAGEASRAVDLRVESNPRAFAIVSDEDADPVAAMAALPPELLKTALEGENPRTVSLLINSMSEETATEVYKRLSAEKRKEVTLRFADTTAVNGALLRHIARAVLNKCETLRSTNSVGNEQGERDKRIAGLVRSLERAERLETLNALEMADPGLTARIKALLYLFEDILKMENSSLQKLLMEVDMKLLASALFGAAPEVQERLQSNLSRRAQDLLKEEIELTGKVPAAEVKRARTTLEEAMQRLDQRGELIMRE